MLALALLGCGGDGRPAETCACDDGHGFSLCEGGDCGPCQCLPLAPATVDPTPAITRYVDADATRGDGTEADPWPAPDWTVLDADSAAGHVLVIFDAGDTWPDRIDVLRNDAGPNRIVL